VHCESKAAAAVGWGQFGNPGRRTSAVGSRYQRTCEGTGDWEDSARAIMNCRQCEIVIVLDCQL
jgi:hypothetical protein